MKKLASVFILTVCFLAACGLGDTQTGSSPEEDEINEEVNNEEENNEEVNGEGVFDELEYKVETNQTDSELTVEMTLTNTSTESAMLSFSSGQKYEITLTNAAGEEVYRYSADKMFTMAIIQEVIPGGEELILSETVQLDEFEPGEYELTATIIVYTINDTEITQSPFEETVTIQIGS
ncbi:hypothetical protein AJ85_06185 [Alkalihalobacillus alcalophilus ATCC 27647 = CGMCC 1.3604]|uniref:Intracellular proteinase inhibitor BsuPI domain-containing protein n=1 Tax=Alkalihalobacillus alcalophilus ATCC 27647 = CGMCC 1.3604 TaxID=1218173 RepID=A0A4S4JTC1_ALKAL|nr:BsuPI-related putative proteinase inhibitor [Alkalihalobacillus alcalophilus]MED1562091.1 BsuPI-related putative proteinase inhibitor [Alkalihalobacillus alcalophilus]THG88363.1 hypothetical protein AJ85_06185 [Alkalihalobacillus alcalophilus ATCC 27647 = CGMCC 1.3604]